MKEQLQSLRKELDDTKRRVLGEVRELLGSRKGHPLTPSEFQSCLSLIAHCACLSGTQAAALLKVSEGTASRWISGDAAPVEYARYAPLESLLAFAL